MISPKKYQQYIDSITDDKLRLITSEIVENTIYINFPTFKYNLQLLINSLPPKFNLLVDSYKIGSEHWVILLIWNQIKDRVIKVINYHYEIDNTEPVVYLDDSIYTGRNAIQSISELVTEYNNNNYDGELEFTDSRGIMTSINQVFKNNIIIACPYISNTSVYYFKEFMERTHIQLQLITSNTTAAVVVTIKNILDKTIYKDITLNELLEYFNDNFNSFDTGIAIYFDHKIAGVMSSFPELYNKIIKNPPSRYKIEELETLLTTY